MSTDSSFKAPAQFRSAKEASLKRIKAKERVINAIRLIFYSTKPYPGDYFDNREEIVIDLEVWLCKISALWSMLRETGHMGDCTCCYTLKDVLPYYDLDFRELLTEKHWEKSATKVDLESLAGLLEQQEIDEAINDITTICEVYIKDEKDVNILDISVVKTEQRSGICEIVAPSASNVQGTTSEIGNLSLRKQPELAMDLHHTIDVPADTDTHFLVGLGEARKAFHIACETNILTQNWIRDFAHSMIQAVSKRKPNLQVRIGQCTKCTKLPKNFELDDEGIQDRILALEKCYEEPTYRLQT